MKTYNKLVRDKIPERLRKQGLSPKAHVAGKREYWKKLKEKLREEVKEFFKAESLEEFADVLEVLDAIATAKKFSVKRLRSAKAQKVRDRGGFKKRIILERV